MPKVSPEHAEARRQQILKAAVHCFAEKGFHPTTMQDICKKAQLSPGAVYLYFPGKEKLIEDLMDYLHEMNKQTFHEIQNADDLRQGLEKALDSFFSDPLPDDNNRQLSEDSFSQDTFTRLDIMFLAEALRNDQTRQALGKNSKRNAALYHQIITEAQEAGVIKNDWSAEVIGELIESMYFSLSIAQTIEPDRSFKQHRNALKTMIISTFFTS